MTEWVKSSCSFFKETVETFLINDLTCKETTQSYSDHTKTSVSNEKSACSAIPYSKIVMLW